MNLEKMGLLTDEEVAEYSGHSDIQNGESHDIMFSWSALLQTTVAVAYSSAGG